MGIGAAQVRRETMMLTYEANTLRQFMKRIQAISKAWETKKDGSPNLWYRGSRKSSWALVPKLYRPNGPAKKLLQTEDEIREEFVRRAPGLIAYRPENAWEWYFLMQHYSAPTRLLDWTEVPLVGLYFAVKDTEGLQDAAVWVLDAWLLNKRVLGKSEVLPPGSAGLSTKDVRKYNAWLHCCPARSRIESIGCWRRVNRRWSRRPEGPVKWAFSRIASRSRSVEFGRGWRPARDASGRWRRGHKRTRRSRFASSLRSRWSRRML